MPEYREIEIAQDIKVENYTFPYTSSHEIAVIFAKKILEIEECKKYFELYDSTKRCFVQLHGFLHDGCGYNYKYSSSPITIYFDICEKLQSTIRGFYKIESLSVFIPLVQQ